MVIAATSAGLLFRLFRGTMNAGRLKKFLQECVFPRLGPGLRRLVLDNTKFHHSAKVKEIDQTFLIFFRSYVN
jgi:hypothetical protein